MKFAKYLKENGIDEWKVHYMQYKVLKKLISAFEMKFASEEDQKFYMHKVEEDAQRIEQWFLDVRNKCLSKLHQIRDELPEDVKKHLPVPTAYVNLSTVGYAAPNKPSFGDMITREAAVKKDTSDEVDKFSSSSLDEDEDDDKPPATTEATKSEAATLTPEKSLDEAVASGDQPHTTIEMDTVATRASEPESISEAGGTVSVSAAPDTTHDADDEKEEFADNSVIRRSALGDDYKESDNNAFDKEWSPSMYLTDSVYTHLPGSAHKELVAILLTLAKLKLFGWQNAEGFRKIIKKFDKRCSCQLTLTFWPQIRLFEFAQETKHTSYMEQCAAVLTTQIIPFGDFDVKELHQKGVNLYSMAKCIQQLETVTEMELPEIVPMSVEPRSYMANERTFLKWMRMGALTAVIGMALLSLNHEPVTGIILIVFSIGVIIRSFHEYRRRLEVLVDRVDHNWDDRLGPKLLVVSLLLPMVTYLVYLACFRDSKPL